MSRKDVGMGQGGKDPKRAIAGRVRGGIPPIECVFLARRERDRIDPS